jgi:hypothetical protein
VSGKKHMLIFQNFEVDFLQICRSSREWSDPFDVFLSQNCKKARFGHFGTELFERLPTYCRRWQKHVPLWGGESTSAFQRDEADLSKATGKKR